MINEEAGFEQIRSWLGQRCGIHYTDQKKDLLLQRLNRVQRAFNIERLAEMSRRLGDSAEHDLQLAVMHAASTNHTYFFREMDVLDKFRDMILPKLAKRQDIRIWSAACSTGDEAYTLAIIIAEALGMDALRRVSILGTDISAPVVERAEAGIFGQRQLEQVPPGLLNKYFTPVGMGQYQVNDAIRSRCTFRRLNLKTQPYPFKQPFQVVFCRNILYYFDVADQKATINAIYDVTEPDGFLITSVTESVRELSNRWENVATSISRKPLGSAA
ncbi:CheR family methyltransferase [Marivivens aquimaris]|uniref:CheR family methyltransferase n=1 Tax=Marivivens aquimaris TaxID=2774876 RepID=UPI00187E198D|nr:protein-glutamate O-methyltransferase CheR [Marivivens aquimaris]